MPFAARAVGRFPIHGVYRGWRVGGGGWILSEDGAHEAGDAERGEQQQRHAAEGFR